MKFEQFKEFIELLAEKDENNLRSIQALITHYFRNKFIPRLDSYQTFVVRCSQNDENEVFKHISRCSYNPNIERIPLQRCNYPGQQVFYCSMFSNTDFTSTSLTCLAETAWEKINNSTILKSYFTLSRWQLKRKLKLWVLPFAENSVEKNRDFKNFNDNYSKKISENCKDSEEVLKALKYMSAIFCKRENKNTYYKISSAFYNSLLFFQKFMSTEYDGLIYPSANTDGAGLNVVLRKELVDNEILIPDVAIMYSMSKERMNLKHITFNIESKETNVLPDGKLSFEI